MNRAIAGTLVVIALATPLYFYLRPRPSVNVATLLRLRDWGLLIVEGVKYDKDDSCFHGTIAEVMEKIRKRKHYSDGMIREYTHDNWGRPFLKEVHQDGKQWRLSMRSLGADGMQEDHDGDDIILELTWDPQADTVFGKVSYVASTGKRVSLLVPPEK